MKLIVLLFIGFIGLEARDIKPNDDDPAPGPPNRHIYDIETSHESYRPAEHEVVATTITADNRKGFSDIFSSMSSENVEYHDNIHYYNNREDFSVENTKSEKLIIDNRSGNKMKDNDGAPTSSASVKSTPITLQQLNAQSRLALDNSSTRRNSITASLESKNSRGDRCEGAPNQRIAKYLKLGDRVIEMDFDYSKEQGNTLTKPKENTKIRMNIDVTHDVFETTDRGGLMAGIIYKGKLILITCHGEMRISDENCELLISQWKCI
jgi:hypothetical protein